jgi:hypothetical protein
METDKGKYFIACVPIHFKKLKGYVRTPNNERYVPVGHIFQCLVDNVKTLNFKFICLGRPKQIIRYATEDEIKKIIEKEKAQ